MFDANEYELLDFGAGRKLERFGSLILDRPSAAAVGFSQAQPQLWSGAGARFELDEKRSSKTISERGHWIESSSPPVNWNIHYGGLQFELKRTPFGHVGVFPEQAANWDWIAEQLRNAPDHETCRVLNLFAYTGGSTLAAAAAGAKVTHVDAARNIVTWARHNANLSGLSTDPIRWIVDDALKFARREVKRGQRYDAVILDPPNYGHGSGGERWKLDEHLADLLATCHELTIDSPRRIVLLTCHATNYGPQRLAELLTKAGFAHTSTAVDAGDLFLTTADGRRLHSGTFARVR
jgi:23S rRNA (cytosine1962-C5)-methyltransferase